MIVNPPDDKLDRNQPKHAERRPHNVASREAANIKEGSTEMKCKHCNAEIVRIDTNNGKIVCNVPAVLYWQSKQPDTSVLTPNGETIHCKLQGDIEKAHGIGYTLHTCIQ